VATTGRRPTRAAPLLNRATLRHSDQDIDEAVAQALAAKDRDLLVETMHREIGDLKVRADNANHLSAKIDTRSTQIEVKVDALSNSVEELSTDVKTLATTTDKVAGLVDSHESFLQSSGVKTFMARMNSIERFTHGVRGFALKVAAAAVGVAAVIQVVELAIDAVSHAMR